MNKDPKDSAPAQDPVVTPMTRTRCPFTGRPNSWSEEPTDERQHDDGTVKTHIKFKGVDEVHPDSSEQQPLSITCHGEAEDENGLQIAYNTQVSHLYHDIKEHKNPLIDSKMHGLTAAERLHRRGISDPKVHDEVQTWAALHLAEYAPELLKKRAGHAVIIGGN